MVVTLVGIVMSVNAIAPLNTLLPMVVSLLPDANMTVFKDLASEKVPYSIDVTPAGMVIAVNALAPLNAESPMDVTPAGMVMAVNALAPLNA